MAAYAWENRQLEEESGSEDELWRHIMDEGEEDIDTTVTPGMEFVRAMLHLIYTSTLSAKTFCVLMWLAARAGIAEAAPYGLPPNAPSGHYMRKIRRKLGWLKTKKFLYMHIPGQGKHDLERTTMTLPILPGHEQFVDDMAEPNNPVPSMLQRMKDEDELPPSYHHHPVVQGAGSQAVYPVAIFLDGVAYSLTDAVIGFWLVSLVCGRRFLIATVRKRNLCSCGCKGWCTFYHIFLMLHWTLQAFKRGQHPSARYDGPWEDGADDFRKLLSDQLFGFLCCLMYIKGDWMELGVTIGLPTWKDALRPCWACNCFVDNMYKVQGLSFEDIVWAINEDQDYFEACTRCEHIVLLRNTEDKRSIVRYLRYDKRKTGARGRALTRDVLVNGVNLRSNDRLEPSKQLPDVGGLDGITNFPLEVIFWRSSDSTLSRHRNPIFDPELGVTPKKSLVVDVLHAVFLGILLCWCRIAIWSLILCGAYGHSGANHEHIVAAVMVIRSHLMRFYKTYERENPGETLTRLADLTPSMLGTSSDQQLKTKGGETWGFALFIFSELKTKHCMLGAEGQRLLHAGDMVVGTIKIWKSNPWKIPRAQAKDPTTTRPREEPDGRPYKAIKGPSRAF